MKLTLLPHPQPFLQRGKGVAPLSPRERGRGEGATSAFLFGLVLAIGSGVASAAAPIPAPERQRELIHLVRQECGFCHGLRLTGGLGSPLTAAAMKDKPAETMIAVILYGIPGTAMPPWQPFVSEAEATWIVLKLQEGFPNDAR